MTRRKRKKNVNKHEKKVDRTQESSESTGSQHHATYSLTSSIADIIIIRSVMHNSITDKDIVIIIIIFVGKKRQSPTSRNPSNNCIYFVYFLLNNQSPGVGTILKVLDT